MTIRRGLNGRTGSLPRGRPSPELNIIQAPELLQRMREKLGVRQAHFMPTLAEGVHCVVILDDVSKDSGSLIQPAFCAVTPLAGDGATRVSSAIIFNPAQSGVVVRIRKITANPIIGSGIPNYVVVNTAFLSAPPNVADFNSAGAEFFQNHNYSHENYPNLTIIRSPMAQVSSGRSVFLGSNIARLARDPGLGGFPDGIFTFEDYRLGPLMACVVQLNSVQLLDSLSQVSFQWTEEPLSKGPAS